MEVGRNKTSFMMSATSATELEDEELVDTTTGLGPWMMGMPRGYIPSRNEEG